MKSSLIILVAALITEGLVSIVAFILWGLFDLTVNWGASWENVLFGVGWMIPLFLALRGIEWVKLVFPDVNVLVNVNVNVPEKVHGQQKLSGPEAKVKESMAPHSMTDLVLLRKAPFILV